jgi:DNA primase
MIEAGLLVSGDDIPVAYDRFRDRIMFPIRDARGKVIAFGGRALAKDAPAKYLNSPETPLFHKGQVLYNLDKARAAAHEAGQVIAVEGYMDTIAMVRAGFAQTVAPLGTALTEDQLRLLWRMAPEPVLCFDGDQAGLKAAYRALDLALPMLKPGYSLKFALLPEGQDPDDLLKTEGPMAIKRVIDAAEPLSDILWRRAITESDQSTPERRAQFERELRELVGQIGDETVRRHYGAELRSRLQALWSDVPAQQQGRVGRNSAPERMRGGRKAHAKPWEIKTPASPQLKALANSMTATRAHEKRERLILLTLINHPQLLDEFLDAFSHIEFSRRPLDSLRRELLEAAAAQDVLDGASLRNHLVSKGFGAELVRLETQARRLNEWFLSAGAASEDARTGLSQMIALHRKHVILERELKAAEAAFAADPSEENLAALKEIREELVSEAGEEALIEGFGQASGRPMDAIS